MLRRLVTFLLGHLRIEVSGGSVERFLNLALAQGVNLWEIYRDSDRMQASLTLGSFYALRRVARGAHCRVRIRERHGLPFVAARIRRRPVWVLGALLSLIFVFWAAGHIWIVRVVIIGPHNLDPRAIATVAAEAGLRPGAWSGNVDMTKVQHHIQSRVPEAAWAVIRIQGTRAVIEVVEKSAYEAAGEAGCINLVARRSGVVEQVIPFQGEPVVKKGDIVRAGDLLVECSLRYWSGGRPAVLPGSPRPPRESSARTVIAQATVKARVTYRYYREMDLYQEVPIPTGRKATRWVLVWKDRSILLWGSNAPPFQRGQEHRQTYTLDWRIWRSPVELVLVSTEEVEIRRDQVPLADALAEAKEQLAARLRWMLGPTDKLLTPVTAEVTERGDGFVGIRVSAETLEEISLPRKGAPLNWQPESPSAFQPNQSPAPARP